MPVLLHHAWLARSSSSFSLIPLPLLSTDCLLPGGLGHPSPPSPKLTPFPSGPRQRPAPMSGTVTRCAINKTTYLEDRCIAHGGKFPSTQVPCLKPTALTLTFQTHSSPHPLGPVLYYNDAVNNFCLLDLEHFWGTLAWDCWFAE